MLDLSLVVCSQNNAPLSTCGPIVMVLIHYRYTGIKIWGNLDCNYYLKELRAFQGWISVND